jgi:MAST domain-containing protein
MKIKYLIIVSILISTTNLSTASNPYGEVYTYDVYYNDKLLPGTDVAKPIIKIGEPFDIKVNMTVYQEYKVSGKLTELGEGYFKVIDGPSKMNQYSDIILKANESHIYEWTVVPTDKWAGGSIPINFHYSIVEKGNPEPVINSEFTVAYCTISNEHYKGETPTSKEQPVSETEPSSASSSASASASASTPAFTLIGAISVLSLVFALFRR